MEVSAAARERLLGQWLALALAHYPERAQQIFAQNPDPFRNPTGRVYRETLRVLVEELLGNFELARVRPAMDELMHVCAVSERPASEVLAFLPAFKALVRAELAPPLDRQAVVDRRVDQLLLLAFDCYVACREKLYQARWNELRRLHFMQERLGGRSRRP